MKLKRIMNLYHSLRIRYKLLLAYFLVAIIPVTGVGYFSYTISAHFSKEQSLNLIRQFQQNSISSINKQLDYYMFLANTIYDNQRIQQLVTGMYIDSYEEYNIANSLLHPVLQSLLNATGSGIYAALIRYNNNKSEIIPYRFEDILSVQNNSDLLKDNKQIYHVLNLARMQDKEWFVQVKGNAEQYLWKQVGDDSRFQYISLLREMRDYSTMQSTKIGLLRLTVRLADILGEESFQDSSGRGVNLAFDAGLSLLSTEKEKKEYYQKHRTAIDSFLSNMEGEDNLILEDRILVRGDLSQTGWKVISVFPITQITENIQKIRNITVLCCILSLLILFYVTYHLSSSFSRRIITIAKQMQKFRKEKPDNADIRESNGDELGFLAVIFNDMTERIDNLIQDNFQANIDKKDAQLKALQAQINPHFLYNSMSAICRLAEFGETDHIISMVKALSKYYRMTLNKGKDIISISDEVEQVKAYIEVYRIRKGETFQVTYDIEESILEYDTVKVILQPFVENIFEHAVGLVKHPINIHITAKRHTGLILFRVKDDGPGIPAEKFDALLMEEKPYISSGYGIRNVDERLKLQFGKDYGVSIQSSIGEGVTVTVVIPVYKAERKEENREQ